jgi:hypothetical protein
MQRQFAIEISKPKQDGEAGIDASEEEKRPEPIGQQGGLVVGA